MRLLGLNAFIRCKNELAKKDWLHRQWGSPNDFATSQVPGADSARAQGLGYIRMRVRSVLRRLFRA